MARRIPTYVYRYLVTASEHAEVPVGTPLIDKRRDRIKVWDFLTDDGIKMVVGERGPRACSECHTLHKLVRDYDHEGEHGETAPYTPWPEGA